MDDLVDITRRAHFNAAHRLHNSAHSDEWNAKTFGPCNNPNFHGHNYEVLATVRGTVNPETGYVVDMDVLKKHMASVLDTLDHRNLNLDVPYFQDVNPTAENIVRYLFKEIALKVDAEVRTARLYQVELFETPRNSVKYPVY